jgi:hypothetical protein
MRFPVFDGNLLQLLSSHRGGHQRHLAAIRKGSQPLSCALLLLEIWISEAAYDTGVKIDLNQKLLESSLQ